MPDMPPPDGLKLWDVTVRRILREDATARVLAVTREEAIEVAEMDASNIDAGDWNCYECRYFTDGPEDAELADVSAHELAAAIAAEYGPRVATTGHDVDGMDDGTMPPCPSTPAPAPTMTALRAALAGMLLRHLEAAASTQGSWLRLDGSTRLPFAETTPAVVEALSDAELVRLVESALLASEAATAQTASPPPVAVWHEDDRPEGMPTDPEVLTKIHDLIATFVGHGPVEDSLTDYVWSHWPRPRGGAARTFHRVQVLSPEELQTFQSTGHLTVPAHRYLSWTHSEEAVDRLALARMAGGTPVIITATVPNDRVVILVKHLYEHLVRLEQEDGDRHDYDTWEFRKYASECEALLRHDEPLALTPDNARVYEPKRSAHAPQAGDMVYEPYEESTDSTISEVIQQETDGTWTVVTPYHGQVRVRWVAPAEWEVVETYG